MKLTQARPRREKEREREKLEEELDDARSTELALTCETADALSVRSPELAPAVYFTVRRVCRDQIAKVAKRISSRGSAGEGTAPSVPPPIE